MRFTAVSLCAGIALLVTASPAAADRPRPIVASHGVKVKAGYSGYCPRRDRRCEIPNFFTPTKAVPVHDDGFLRINARRRVRRLRLDLDCPRRRVMRFDRTRWIFALPDVADCSRGALKVTYKQDVVLYTFALERHGHGPCELDASKTVAENAFAGIYSVDRFVGGEGGRDYETAFLACNFGSERSQMLGRDYCGYYSGCDFFDHPVLAEAKAAYVTGFADNRYGNDKRFYLRVLDTRSFVVEREVFERVGDPSSDRHITAVVLKANGSVAWILYLRDYTGTAPAYYSQTYEVWKSDRSASRALLESSPDIDPDSLTLQGSTLSWIDAGELRSATLD